ncbi:hypothetical protein M758_7G117100 [Ceratodon purpureus]|nr:hypothetical protein M758_7G117100 [Ceratodon purpureus]
MQCDKNSCVSFPSPPTTWLLPTITTSPDQPTSRTSLTNTALTLPHPMPPHLHSTASTHLTNSQHEIHMKFSNQHPSLLIQTKNQLQTKLSQLQLGKIHSLIPTPHPYPHPQKFTSHLHQILSK